MKNIDDIFDLLDEWRQFPGYQLERRADIFFAVFLPDIMKCIIDEDITLEMIIPEFPLKSESRKDFRPLRIDYVVFASKKVYFIELKTSMSSRKTAQDENMERAKNKGLTEVIREAREISENSKSKKYAHFINRLDILARSDAMNRDIEIVYIQPKNPNDSPNIITFDQIVEKIEGTSDFSVRFCESLKLW